MAMENSLVSIGNAPPKTNMDTQNDGFLMFFKCISFQIWLFWVSMLVFGGVHLQKGPFFIATLVFQRVFVSIV